MDSATLAKQLADYDSHRVTSTDALNEALGKYGVPEIRNTVSGLRTTVANTTSALNNVDPSVTGRTQGSLVTEAQRQRQVNNERAPIAEQLGAQGKSLADNQQTLSEALGMATGEANNKVADWDRGRSVLSSQYDIAYKREQDQAERAAQQAAAAEQSRQFNASNSRLASSGGGGGGGGNLSERDITAGIRQGLDKVKGRDGHVAPADLARAYSDWMQSGLSDASFWKNFQGYWNPKQANYKQQFNAAR